MLDRKQHLDRGPARTPNWAAWAGLPLRPVSSDLSNSFYLSQPPRLVLCEQATETLLMSLLRSAVTCVFTAVDERELFLILGLK